MSDAAVDRSGVDPRPVGVAVAGVGWFVALSRFPGTVADGNLGGAVLAVGLLLVAWVALPVLTYLDVRHVRARSDWRPDAAFWVLLAVVPLVNLLSTVGYLHNRVGALGLG